jgi:hypothetical protein
MAGSMRSKSFEKDKAKAKQIDNSLKEQFVRITPEGPEAGVLALQDAAGNQSVTKLLQLLSELLKALKDDQRLYALLMKDREDQEIVGYISDLIGGKSFPYDSVWSSTNSAFEKAHLALKEGSVDRAKENIKQAQESWQEARRTLSQYRQSTTSGAETSTTVLEGTAALGALAAIGVTGGAAASAGAGLLGTSAVVGSTAGLYGMAQEQAGQAGEMYAGLRKERDVLAILRRGATDAVLGFVAALTGGFLSGIFKRVFGSYLSKALIKDDVLREIGEITGLKGPLPRDFFLTRGQQLFADFFAGVGSAPITTAVSIVLQRLKEEASWPDRESFVEEVFDQMIQAGIMQVFLGFIHTYGSRAPQPSAGKTGAPKSGWSPYPGKVARIVKAIGQGAEEGMGLPSSYGSSSPVSELPAITQRVGKGKVTDISSGEVGRVSKSSLKTEGIEVPAEPKEAFLVTGSGEPQPYSPTAKTKLEKLPPEPSGPFVVTGSGEPQPYLPTAETKLEKLPRKTRGDPRSLLSMQEQVNFVQYDPDINSEAKWRMPKESRFSPPKGGGVVKVGDLEYHFDANGYLLEASTNKLSLGIRDPVMYDKLPGKQANEDFGHLLGIDFGHIDARLGPYGGYRQTSSVNRPTGEGKPHWYNAERDALKAALSLLQQGKPYFVKAQAKGHINGIPQEARITVESEGKIVYDSQWLSWMRD